jgi:hypothetical protein
LGRKDLAKTLPIGPAGVDFGHGAKIGRKALSALCPIGYDWFCSTLAALSYAGVMNLV